MIALGKGWFETTGEDDDVVISTRMRFGRNIDGTPFVDTLDKNQEEALIGLCTSAFNKALPESIYIRSKVSNFSPIERRVLTEKRLIPQQYSLNHEYPVFIDKLNSTAGYVKDTDHIRFASIHGGREVLSTYRRCREIENLLEQHIDFAAQIEWGYLSPDLTSSGLGARGSFLMHLPGLVRTDMIENALKAVIQHGFTVKGFYSDSGKSMADLYQVSNGLSFGGTEDEFCQKLDTLGKQLIHYERKGREELYKKEAVEIEDSVMRSFGILRYCKQIDYLEALEHLSNIRLGSCLGILDIALPDITKLFVLSEKSHIQGLADVKTEKETNIERATLIRDVLLDSRQEAHHV